MWRTTPAPLVLVVGEVSEADLAAAAGLAAAYSDAPVGTPVRVSLEEGGSVRVLELEAPAKERFKEFLI